MSRKQFTFYRSYYEAVKILPKKEQIAVLLAVCGYALDGEEPQLAGTASAIFSLIKPTLDSGRRKAESGKQGGSKTQAKDKQTKSKPKANNNQTAREKENEKEGENECSLPPVPPAEVIDLSGLSPALGEAMERWLKYKAERRESYKPTGLKALVTQVQNSAAQYGDAAVIALIDECMAANWKGIIFDKLKNRTQKPPPFGGDRLLEMIRGGVFDD